MKANVEFLNWMHAITSIVQELAMKERMVMHADQLANATRDLVHSITVEDGEVGETNPD